MSMFDDLICEYPLPDGETATTFQTKSFDRALDVYKITEKGELLHPNIGRVQFTGTCNFYTSKRTGEWLEYVATFKDGQLLMLTVAEPHQIHPERQELLQAIQEIKEENDA